MDNWLFGGVCQRFPEARDISSFDRPDTYSRTVPVAICGKCIRGVHSGG